MKPRISDVNKGKQKVLVLTLSALMLAQTWAGPIYGDSRTLEMTSSVASQAPSAGMSEDITSWEVGKTYHHFVLQRKVDAKDLEAQVYELVHEKNGGKLIYVASSDSNKWFGALVKTPATDDTGVNHILEHAVLEGSEKYNFKSPFTELSKRSVNTYMNAMTGMDFTAYPVASENNKDFDNLMAVYLDAVFAPRVAKDPRMMQQEGWRYEIDPRTGNLTFNGIVFNELKGVSAEKMTGPYEAINRLMYPDTKYRFNSGGDPLAIVDLSHKQLAATYAKYYNPSNICLFLYGKMDLGSKLDYIDEQYYSKLGRGNPYEDHRLQVPFKTAKRLVSSYPADKGAVKSKDSILTLNLVLSGVSQKDKLGLDILMTLLAGADDSPLKMAVTDEELGTSFSAYVSTDYAQPLISMTAEGGDSRQLNAYGKLLQKTLEEVSNKGIDKKRIQAVMNSYNLDSRLQRLSVNNGENAMYQVLGGFVADQDPLDRLNDDALIQEIQKEALEGPYFEGLIKRYLLNNTHRGLAAFEPDAAYMVKMENKLLKKAADRQKKMTPAVRSTIKSNLSAFKKWQAEPVDEDALKSLPDLKLSDLEIKNRAVTLEKKTVAGVPVLAHEVSSRGTTQLKAYFDLSVLSEEELAYLDLFNTILSSSATKNHKAEEMAQLESLYTSGIYVGATVLKDAADPQKYTPYYSVSTSFLNENGERAADLLTDRLSLSDMDDKELVREKLEQLVSNMETNRTDSSLDVAQTMLMANLTQQGALGAVSDVQGYKMLVQANRHFDTAYPKIKSVLSGMAEKLFTKTGCTLSVASDEEGLKSFDRYADPLVSALGQRTGTWTKQLWSFPLKRTKLGLITPSQSQFIAAGFDSGTPASGSDYVFAKMLSDGYMYDKIRLDGGAYGGGMHVSRTGIFEFYTYRDPNLKKSLDSIQSLGAYAKGPSFHPRQSEMDAAIISILGSMEASVDVYDGVNREDTEFLSGYDKARETALKQEILKTTAIDLPAFSAKLEQGLKRLNYVVAGSESSIKKEKSLFDTVRGMLDLP